MFNAAKNSGVASGNGFPASGATTMREILRLAAYTAAFDSSAMLRPCRYTSSSGVSYAGGVPVSAQCVSGYTSRMLNSRRASGCTGFGAPLNGGPAQQLPDDVLLTFFPREPSGDINWMDNIRPGFLGGEHGAVQTARQHHEAGSLPGFGIRDWGFEKRHVLSHQEN